MKYLVAEDPFWDRLYPLLVQMTIFDTTARCTLPKLIKILQDIVKFRNE